MLPTTILDIISILLGSVSIVLCIVVLRNLLAVLRGQKEIKATLGTKESAFTSDGKTSFIPILVHELRAPISVIKGASDLMLKDAQSLTAGQVETLLSQIRNSSSGLLKMIGDILDVSKMEAGKFEVNKVVGNIATVLKEECGYFEPLAKVKDIDLTLHIEENPLELTFDPERLKQVMNNLLSNALKFTEAGGVVAVTASRSDREKAVVVCVADTGVGINEEEKTKLFQKYVQGNNQNHSKEKGTGLGLVVAKGIVSAHGGKIWIESNQPKGTRFLFTIPYEDK